MKSEIDKYITAAKMIVYDKERADIFLPMLETQSGAVHAVLNVVGALEKRKPIPPQVKPILLAQIYLMMVDVAMMATGDKPDKNVMKATLAVILGRQ